jgi:multiple sugar transport system permease protein
MTRRYLTPYYFVAPAIILLVVLMLYPMITVVRFSLFDNYIMVENPQWVGFEHFIELLFHDRVFPRALLNTALFTTASVALHVVLGLTFAILLNEPINGRAQSFFRVILILPWVFTAAVVAVNWRLILNPLGVFNFFLKSMGIIDSNITWFGHPGRALPALIFVNMWRGYPFVMVSLLAGLQGIPQVLYEAAKIDGANAWQRFLFVTIPQLMPVLLSIGLLDIIWTFRLFPLVWLTTGGGPGHASETLSTYTYKLAFSQYQYSQGSAVAVIILVVTLGLSYFYIKRQRME